MVQALEGVPGNNLVVLSRLIRRGLHSAPVFGREPATQNLVSFSSECAHASGVFKAAVACAAGL